MSDDDDVRRENANHWIRAKELCKEHAVGHEDALRIIMEYVTGETVQPLVIEGTAGQGKSTLLARAAFRTSEALERILDRRIQRRVVVRFCGETGQSGRCYGLLKSIGREFEVDSDYCGAKAKLLSSCSYKDAKRFLGDVFRSGNCNGILVVFIDAVDELDSCEEFVNWLPARIANNVKVIISCNADGETAGFLREKITNQSNIVKMGQLSTDLCTELLRSLLVESKQRLDEDQLKLAEKSFSGCPLPLYVHLLHKSVQRNPYTFDNETVLEMTLEKCVVISFKNLEKVWGTGLVSAVLGLLVTEPGGLSDLEMQELLSRNYDDVISKDFSGNKESLSGGSCFPTVNWIRIRSDSGHVLKQGSHFGFTVTQVAHRCISRLAEERYLKSYSSKMTVHGQIADYFKVSPDNICGKQNDGTYVKTNSNTNYRKLELMPYHLHRSRRFKELNDLVYFNFFWILRKLKALSIDHVLDDYRLSREASVLLVSEALEMSQKTLTRNPQLLAVELSSRLLHHYSTYDNIRSLIDQCDAAAVAFLCPLVPYRAAFHAAGSLLQRIVRLSSANSLDGTGFSVVETGNRKLLLQKAPPDVRMRVWDVASGEQKPEVVLTSGSEAFPTPDGRFCCVFRGFCLRIFHLDSGDLYADIDFGSGVVNSVVTSTKYFIFGFERTPGPVVIDLENGFIVGRFHYRSTALDITQDGGYFVSNSGETVHLHALPLLERKGSVKLSAVANKLLFTRRPGSQEVLAMLGDGSLQVVSFNATKRSASSKLLFQDIDLKDFKLSKNNLHILVRLSRSLYLLGSSGQGKSNSAQKLQVDGQVSDAAYLDAAFTFDDTHLVAARSSYLVVWNVESGELVRTMMFSEERIVRMFAMKNSNFVLTIFSDGATGVWNMDRLSCHIGTNRVLTKEVTHLAVGDRRYICASSDGTQVCIGSLDSEEIRNLSSYGKTPSSGGSVVALAISKGGKFGIVTCKTAIDQHGFAPDVANCNVETEDVLWNLEDKPYVIHRIQNSMECSISSDESKVAFIVSNFDSKSSSICKIVLVDLKKVSQSPTQSGVGEVALEHFAENIEFSDDGNNTLSFLLRSSPHNQLVVATVGKPSPFEKLRYIDSNLFLEIDRRDEEHVVDIKDRRTIEGGKILITVEIQNSENSEQTLDSSRTAKTNRFSAIFFDLSNNSVTRRINLYLRPSCNSSLDIILISRQGGTLLDHDYNVFRLDEDSSGENPVKLDLDATSVVDLTFVLDGQYLVAITGDGEQLELVDTASGRRVCHMEVHSRARVIRTCCDDRTIVLGCASGCVMAFVIIAGSTECVVKSIPSRKKR